jgi:hypothetical protein
MGRTSAANLRAVPVSYTNDQIVSAATGRWGEAANEIKLAEPYVIDRPDGDPITITPLTRRRRKALKSAQAAYIMLGAQLAEVTNDQTGDQATVTRIQALIDDADDTYNKALFGEDVYQEIVDYFENLPEEFWDAFYIDVHNALVNRVELPEDVCSKCGQQIGGDDGVEGKDESSSTSSTDTGTKSAATSAKSAT